MSLTSNLYTRQGELFLKGSEFISKLLLHHTKEGPDFDRFQTCYIILLKENIDYCIKRPEGFEQDLFSYLTFLYKQIKANYTKIISSDEVVFAGEHRIKPIKHYLVRGHFPDYHILKHRSKALNEFWLENVVPMFEVNDFLESEQALYKAIWGSIFSNNFYFTLQDLFEVQGAIRSTIFSDTWNSMNHSITTIHTDHRNFTFQFNKNFNNHGK